VPARWVAGDEVYGADPGLRSDLEKRGTGYVLAVACRHTFTTGLRTSRADELARRLPRSAWQRYSAGPGAKGHRYYDWAWLATDPGQPGHRWLLIRRNRTTRELAYYRCYAPRHVPLPTLVKVAGLRWTVEVGHLWHRSSCAAFSWLRSLLGVGFLFGWCPAGASVEAWGAGSALA
jgi:hypothetical protein